MKLKFVTCILDLTQFLVRADTDEDAIKIAHKANTSEKAAYTADEMGEIDMMQDYIVDDVDWDLLREIICFRDDIWFVEDGVIAFLGC